MSAPKRSKPPAEPWYVKRMREDLAREEVEREAERLDRERWERLTPEELAAELDRMEDEAEELERIAELAEDESDDTPPFRVGRQGLHYVGDRAGNNPWKR